MLKIPLPEGRAERDWTLGNARSARSLADSNEAKIAWFENYAEWSVEFVSDLLIEVENLSADLDEAHELQDKLRAEIERLRKNT